MVSSSALTRPSSPVPRPASLMLIGLSANQLRDYRFNCSVGNRSGSYWGRVSGGSDTVPAKYFVLQLSSIYSLRSDAPSPQVGRCYWLRDSWADSESAALPCSGPVYIAELAPARLRGRLVGTFQINIVIGILFAYMSNYLFSTF